MKFFVRCWDLNARSFAWEPGFGDGLLFEGNLETGIPGHPFEPGETRTRDLSISRVFSWCFTAHVFVEQQTKQASAHQTRDLPFEMGNIRARWDDTHAR